MSKFPHRLFVVALTLALMGLGPSPVTISLQRPGPSAIDFGTRASPPSKAVPEATKKQAAQAFRKLPLYFVENKGQTDERVAYYLQGRNATVYFAADGLTYALMVPRRAPISLVERLREAVRPRAALAAAPRQHNDRQRWALKLDFIGTNPGVRPKGQDLHPTVISYFKGRQDQWKANLKTYSTIVYENLWPGIDLLYSAGREMKYAFVVKPGADPNQIRLAYRGATGIRVTEGGLLEVSTPLATVTDDKPYSYQETSGRRDEVATAFVLEPSAGASHVYRFRVGPYDNQRPLVIDPTVLVYAGYIGGALAGEVAEDVAVDSSGNAYVTGSTSSDELSFPVTVGPDLTSSGFGDAFVAKLNAAGTALVYAGYIAGGASQTNVGMGIAVDSAGSAYVTGETFADESTFPVVGGPDLTANGNSDAFLVKVNSDGTGLVYAGFIGGFDDDAGTDVAVDSAGSAYVTGFTFSSETRGFPVAVGPSLVYKASFEAFVAKVDPSGQGLVYAGYIGSDADDIGYGIAVDTGGNAYVTGDGGHATFGFPVKIGPDLTGIGGFIAKVKFDGTELEYAGYVGASGRGVAVDASGAAYVTGLANSTSRPQPTVGPDLSFNGGTLDGFIAKVSPDGTGFVYAGYIGGADRDEGRDVAVDSAGNAYVTGTTASTEASFPVTGGPDLTFSGAFDAFVVKISAAGAFSSVSYIGGDQIDAGHGIAVDGSGNVYVAGLTASAPATFPDVVGPDVSLGGEQDGFVAKIAEPIMVSIDIKPENFPNPIPDVDVLNLNSKQTPVAIFTTPTFNAATVSVGSVTFAGAPVRSSTLEDVDGDGDVDLKMKFDNDFVDLDCSSTEALLFGQAGGVPIFGSDMVLVKKDNNGVKCP